jgi:hypothetical protein
MEFELNRSRGKESHGSGIQRSKTHSLTLKIDSQAQCQEKTSEGRKNWNFCWAELGAHQAVSRGASHNHVRHGFTLPLFVTLPGSSKHRTPASKEEHEDGDDDG